MKRFLRDNGLTLFFLGAFLLSLLGQALAGQARYNEQQLTDGGDPIPLLSYVGSSDFAVDVAENWQSEYLQFLLFIVVTVWLVQRGSPESKRIKDIGDESEEQQQMGAYAHEESPGWARGYGWRRSVYANSLGLVMGLIFVLSWLGQSVAGTAAYNAERLSRLQDPVSWGQYLGSAEFWSRTFQNWQSEMLAVASMVVLSIYLRQRASPESKPVGEAHATTGEEN
ncbi:hypothetical protein HNP84_002702 [Thermocatellispora tengchongensis]|uniref:Uncharacterized protein n=1 Tax=Thermocatellispora tengchongensis TaxID=1073253 RepID=A0A840P535_9ACTN|nr:DUF6766 family protein [Thermocatellispora tengchongensis]MBB5132981.1 hypothetical protein [Thermocatellispora tengchongensis]